MRALLWLIIFALVFSGAVEETTMHECPTCGEGCGCGDALECGHDCDGDVELEDLSNDEDDFDYRPRYGDEEA